MSVLIFAEHNGQHLSPSFAKVLGAAQTLGEVTVVLMGTSVATMAKEASQYQGVKEVITVEDASLANPTAEQVVANLAPLAEKASYVLAAASTYSRGGLARLAARLKRPMLSDLTAVRGANAFTRPIYAGAIQAEVEVNPPLVATVRFPAFAAAAQEGGAPVRPAAYVAPQVASRSEGVERVQSNRPELTAARVVISGGRGLGSKENFSIVEKLADKLNAAVGASRAAVDAGYAPNDWQVGQTGKVVAPELYIAVGISGAVQHLAGIKGAKTIVAINKDPNAPIFQMADYGLVGDLFQMVPELTDKLK